MRASPVPEAAEILALVLECKFPIPASGANSHLALSIAVTRLILTSKFRGRASARTNGREIRNRTVVFGHESARESPRISSSLDEVVVSIVSIFRRFGKTYSTLTGRTRRRARTDRRICEKFPKRQIVKKSRRRIFQPEFAHGRCLIDDFSEQDRANRFL